MDNIIDYIKNGREKISKVLDYLSDQLELLHNGGDVDYLILLDAVHFLETYPDSFLVPKENAVFEKSTENYNFFGYNKLINEYRAENAELKTLLKGLREYINAAMGDVVFEKEKFEHQLDTCIQLERKHVDTEINHILPLVDLMLTRGQIKALSKSFKSDVNNFDDMSKLAVSKIIYQLATNQNKKDQVRN